MLVEPGKERHFYRLINGPTATAGRLCRGYKKL